MTKDVYTNGQKTYELIDGELIYYFKNGGIKARGPYAHERMQGEWHFYKEVGHLWQVGHFKDDVKHGRWIRYDANGMVTYDKTFTEGKISS